MENNRRTYNKSRKGQDVRTFLKVVRTYVNRAARNKGMALLTWKMIIDSSIVQIVELYLATTTSGLGVDGA